TSSAVTRAICLRRLSDTFAHWGRTNGSSATVRVIASPVAARPTRAARTVDRRVRGEVPEDRARRPTDVRSTRYRDRACATPIARVERDPAALRLTEASITAHAA